jgi:endonuclease G
MCPAGDRSATQEDVDATFFMTNMLAQTAELNQGPWERLEAYSRELVRDDGMELYVIAGGTGTLGRIARGNVNIPSHTWKVIVVLPERNGNDLARVTRDTRVIAVSMPNRANIFNARWSDFRVPVDEIERVTRLDLLSELDDSVEQAIEGSTDREVINQRPKGGNGPCSRPGRLRPRGRDR